jgi:hypothetical protein
MGQHNWLVGHPLNNSGPVVQGAPFLYISAIVLRVEEHFSGSNDETAHVSDRRKVKSRFRFAQIIFACLIGTLIPSGRNKVLVPGL